MAERALVLFDVDGTLLMPGDRRHARALLDAFREVYGLEPELEGIALAGMLDAQIARQLLERHPVDLEEAEKQIEQVMTRMGELYHSAMDGASNVERLLPGAVEAVNAVHERGWLAGALTGNARRVAEVKLGAAGLMDLTVVGAFGDSAVERGHLVEVAIDAAERHSGVRYDARETVLVGDTPQDIAAARYASARVVAVATGRYDVETLAAHGPDATLEDLQNTEAFISAVEAALGNGD